MIIKSIVAAGDRTTFTLVMDNGIEIKGCKKMTGKNGEFISSPATKLSNGTWFNHCYFPAAASEEILALLAGDPVAASTAAGAGGQEEEPPFNADDDIPFSGGSAVAD